jgi:hypothetical protein
MVVWYYYKILINVAAYIIPGYVYVVRLFTTDQCTIHTHTHHTPNQELHMRPHLPKFYPNDTLLYCILLF